LLDVNITKQDIYGEQDHGVIYKDFTDTDTVVHPVGDVEGREVLKLFRCSYGNAILNAVSFRLLVQQEVTAFVNVGG
jgi:hypothetical protein